MVDHYKTLGVERDASKEEIKAAFRRCALEFHPDRHSRSPPPVRDWALRRFKQASEAYEVLVDDSRRSHYDCGGGGGGYPRRYPGGGRGRYGYGGGGYGGGGGGGPRSSAGSGGWRVEWDALFKYLTSRRFSLNLLLASCLLGGTIVIEKSGEAIWKVNNSGKSFEATIQSIEKTKAQKDNR